MSFDYSQSGNRSKARKADWNGPNGVKRKTELIQRNLIQFWTKVNKQGPIHPDLKTRCWIYTGYTDKDGYGGHRRSWKIHRGEIPKGMFICHKCDNPSCVRPDHLFLGDAAANRADSVSKERHAFGDRNGSRTCPDRRPFGDRNGSRKYPERLARGKDNFIHNHPEVTQGENNGNSKLAETEVTEIRKLWSTGKLSQAYLALKFGVSTPTISSIVTRRTWRHVK